MKMGLIGLTVLAFAGFAAAQTISALDRALLVQSKRFEGSYKLSSGETSFKLTDEKADFEVDAGDTKLKAALAPKAGKASRATLDLDGRTVEGKAEIEGRTLTLTFEDGKTTYKITLSLTARDAGDLKVEKGDKTLVSAPIRRA